MVIHIDDNNNNNNNNNALTITAPILDVQLDVHLCTSIFLKSQVQYSSFPSHFYSPSIILGFYCMGQFQHLIILISYCPIFTLLLEVFADLALDYLVGFAELPEIPHC